ncbi:hypothetical protein ABPG77_001864 [Micractinium sp. CCAP 211/92]
MTGSPAKPPPLGLRRTSVNAFLRTVGKELRSAAEFLERPGSRIYAARASSQAAYSLAAPPQLQVCNASLEGGEGAPSTDSSSSETAQSTTQCSGGTHRNEAEVPAMLGMLHPAAGLVPQLPAEPWCAAGTDACPSQQQEQQQQQQQQQSLGPSLARPPARALQTQLQQQRIERRRRQRGGEQGDSHAKVLTWLTINTSEPADTIPAVRAAERSLRAAPYAAPAAQPTAAGMQGSDQLPARPRFPGNESADWRCPQAEGAAPAALPAVHPWPQKPWPQKHLQGRLPRNLALQSAWQPRKPLLARLPCAGCGGAAAECCCGTADAPPLRLLRPRQPNYDSPSRRIQQGQAAIACSCSPSCKRASQPVGHQRRCIVPLAAAAAPNHAEPQPGSSSRASRGSAYCGASHPPAAPPTALPVTSALRCPASGGCGGGCAVPGCCDAQRAGGHHSSWAAHDPQPASSGGSGGLDVWTAYLASRKRPAGLSSHGYNAGPVGQLQAIARRVCGMQGDIASFLLTSKEPRASGSHSHPQAANRLVVWPKARQEARGVSRPAPAVAEQLAKAAGSSARQLAVHGGRSVGDGLRCDPFTDDTILTILTGTDFNRAQQAAAAAAGQAAAAGKPSSQAVQRLKKARAQAAQVLAVRDFARSRLRLLLAAGLGVVALNAASSLAAEWYYKKQVLDTLMRGVLPPPLPPPELERSELRQRMRELLEPPEADSFYKIVTGPPGGGKSTLLREACRNLGSGVGYLDVNPAFEVDFGRDLGNAFNFRLQDHLSFLNTVAQPVLGTKYEDPRGQHPLATTRRSAEALHDAAREFRAKTGRPFVLVIDSADRLARNEDSEKVLAAMRAFARDWAQEGSITTIFVAHEWSTVEKLIGDHPVQSRAGPPLRVPDVTPEESLQYLEALGVAPLMAEKCAGLVGGSLLSLQRCAALAKAGLPFAEIKQQMLDLIELAFVQAGLLDQSPQREGGLRCIEALLRQDGGISAADFRERVPDREHQLALLGRGVLSFDGRRLEFASSLAATYAAEVLRSRLPRSVAEQHKLPR